MVHRHLELVAGLPQRFVTGIVQLRNTETGGCARQQHAAEETVVAGPAHLGDRTVDVEEIDLHHTRPASRRVVAEVDEPAVVRLEPGPSALGVGCGQRGRLRGQRGLGIEGWDGVGIDDLGDDAIGLEIGQSTRRVPVASAEIPLEIVVGVLIGGGPLIELGMPSGFEIGPVVRDVRTRVTVGGYDDVALLSAGTDRSHVSPSVCPPADPKPGSTMRTEPYRRYRGWSTSIGAQFSHLGIHDPWAAAVLSATWEDRDDARRCCCG